MRRRSARTPTSTMVPLISATATEIEVMVGVTEDFACGLAGAHPQAAFLKTTSRAFIRHPSGGEQDWKNQNRVNDELKTAAPPAGPVRLRRRYRSRDRRARRSGRCALTCGQTWSCPEKPIHEAS